MAAFRRPLSYQSRLMTHELQGVWLPLGSQQYVCSGISSAFCIGYGVTFFVSEFTALEGIVGLKAARMEQIVYLLLSVLLRFRWISGFGLRFACFWHFPSFLLALHFTSPLSTIQGRGSFPFRGGRLPQHARRSLSAVLV